MDESLTAQAGVGYQVGSEFMLPLDELKALDRQIDQIRNLADLRPIFYRLDEITKQYSDDFEVQLSASEVKQRVVARGTTLRALGQTLQNEVMQPEAPAGNFSPESSITPPPLSEAVPPQADFSGNGTDYRFATAETPAATPDAGMGQAPPIPPRPASPPRAVKPSGNQMKRALLFGGVVGVLLAVILIGFLVNRSRARRAATATVHMAIVTVPDGASIRVNGEPKCISNCSVTVPPGEYQVTAFLDGYEPAAGNVAANSKQPAELSLTLAPQAQTIRILTDSPQGTVTLDGRITMDLQDGQFVLDKVSTGTHQLKVTTRSGEAAFSVVVADAALPKIEGPVAVRDYTAVLVSSLGSRARVVTNAPAKLSVNGAPQSDAGPEGVDVNGFHPGVGEFVVGSGNEQRTMSETFSPAPALTVFLKSDVSTGTLVVSAGEDDARVLLNGKEYPRKTKKGELRIQTLGPVSVRVAKDGFELAAPQLADVKKGSETRLSFKLQPIPKVASLQIRGATPGAEVLIDQKPAGTVADDGSFTANAVPPGDHQVELRKEQFVPRRFQRSFQAGLAVSFSGPEVSLSSAVGTVRLTRAPADAAVTYRRTDETQAHELRANQVDLPPGTYIFAARAPGYSDRTERIQVAMAEPRNLDLTLARVVAAAPPPPKVAGIGEFQDPASWSKQGDLWVHKGGGFVPFRLPDNGTFTFTVRLLKGGSIFRGGRIRWAVQYVDAKNYALFEMDRKTLTSKVIEGGKTFDRGKYENGLADNDKDMAFAVQVDVSPGQLIHRVKNGNEWLPVDSWKEPGRNFTEGKFGFMLQGSDEIGISDFRFVPR